MWHEQRTQRPYEQCPMQLNTPSYSLQDDTQNKTTLPIAGDVNQLFTFLLLFMKKNEDSTENSKMTAHKISLRSI